jgi:hypothetical protein
MSKRERTKLQKQKNAQNAHMTSAATDQNIISSIYTNNFISPNYLKNGKKRGGR